MSKVTISGNASGTGTLTIAAPNTNSDITLNLPTTMGTNNGSSVVTTDAAGNLGLGVAPSAWSAFKAVQVNHGSLASTGVGNHNVSLAANAYFDGSNWRYIGSSYATELRQNGGQFAFSIAPSGTAGNAISFTQAMTLDASGNLLVARTSGYNTGTYQSQKIKITGGIGINSDPSDNVARLTLIGDSATGDGTIDWGGNGNFNLKFSNNGAERARITSGGNLWVGTTSGGYNSQGFEAGPGYLLVTRNASTPMWVNRLSNDGLLVEFAQDTAVEGSISVSGTTVSYNGGHLSRWAQTNGPKDESLVKGTVLSNLDEMNVYTDADGNPVENEQLNKVKVSDVEGDANVAGVFVNWDHDKAHSVDEINMAMTGDMIIRIAQGVTVQRGDLLMSAGDGTAKPQGDDIVRSKTVAKVTSTHVTCTYADGSFCVPCVLMAC